MLWLQLLQTKVQYLFSIKNNFYTYLQRLWLTLAVIAAASASTYCVLRKNASLFTYLLSLHSGRHHFVLETAPASAEKARGQD